LDGLDEMVDGLFAGECLRVILAMISQCGHDRVMMTATLIPILLFEEEKKKRCGRGGMIRTIDSSFKRGREMHADRQTDRQGRPRYADRV